MITKDPNFKVLHKTDQYIAEYVFDYAYLINRINRKEIFMGDFYGDPDCALISSDNNWCIIGGNQISIWTLNEGVREITDEELSWVCGIKQTSLCGAKLLIDPCSEYGSIWSINTSTLKRCKLKEYKSLDEEYKQIIDW